MRTVNLVFSRMVEELGIHGTCKSSYMVHSGGSTSDNAVRSAHGLIATGHAQNVLVLQCERWGSADLKEMITMLSKNGQNCGQSSWFAGRMSTSTR